MLAGMHPHLEPTKCLDFEPVQAHRLEWLPLAVRHKLDLAGLKLGLRQWGALPLAGRTQLLRCPAGEGFALLAQDAGAHTMASPVSTLPDEAMVVRGLNCTGERAREWLAATTPFSRYALCKALQEQCAPA